MEKVIDNFELIKKHLYFEEESDMYFVQVLQRKKDHPMGTIIGANNSSRLIKAYYIYSIEDMDKFKKEMITLGEVFGARVMINLNKRNTKKLALDVVQRTVDYIKGNHTNSLHKMYNELCGQYIGSDKRWLLDIDTKDVDYLDKVREAVLKCDSKNQEFITVPSKSGYHLITYPFNTTQFTMKEIDIHKNNPTLLYFKYVE